MMGTNLNHQAKIEVFFDGECPLCIREIKMLKALDRKHRIIFTDISAAEFDPGSVGLTMEQLMTEIRGRLPNGQLVQGVEVFRRLYSAVGFGPLVAISRVPGISHLLNLGYSWFAKNRLKLTGRCNADSCQLPVSR